VSFRREVLAEGVEVWNGDCLEILPTLGKFDACVSDPPYGIDYDPTRSQKSAASGSRKAMAKIAGDSKPFDPSPLLSLADHFVLWGANHYASKLPDAGGWLVWDKREGGALFRGFAMSDCELAWCTEGKMVRTISHRWCGHLRDSERELFVHPTQKPVAVMQWCIEQMPAATQFIIDPYMGSGTTGVAAVKLGRKFTGIELDAGHFDTACKRISAALREPDMFVSAPPPKPAEQLSILDGDAA
jgi:DNA modification methylase